MKSWFIENPVSKDLVKSLTLRMSPYCEKEFIIVMKAPNDRIQFSLASFISIRLANARRFSSSLALIEKRLLEKGGEDLDDIDFETIKREREEASQEIRVMLIGRLENPKLECLKVLNHVDTGCDIIPLGIKKNVPQQKFRLPFKNMSLSHDADFDFTFVKTSTATDSEEG